MEYSDFPVRLNGPHVVSKKAHLHVVSDIATSILVVITLSSLVMPNQAQAIPAFARKYDVQCTACHTAPPALNTFGQRFLENGYQLPGTEDGGTTGKKKLGDVTLDDVGKYLAFRLVGNAV